MTCKLVISVSDREAKAIGRVLNWDARGTGYLNSDGTLRDGVLKKVLSEFEFARKFGPRQSFITTQDTCENCSSKLSNAETARRNWQGAAHGLAKRLKELEAELAHLLGKAHESQKAE